MLLQRNRRQLAVLIDPDKHADKVRQNLIDSMSINPPDFIFVGGSTGGADSTNALVHSLKDKVKAPIILFPGNSSQISFEADGILFLSLISGRNAEWLIGQQVKASKLLKNSDLEVVSTGYILVDGGVVSSVQKVSNTTPISPCDIDKIVSTAIAGELIGMKAIYLEAGSGAKNPIPKEVISAVRTALDCVLIVGGGIRTIEQANDAYDSGADIVVVGNALEKDNDLYSRLICR